MADRRIMIWGALAAILVLVGGWLWLKPEADRFAGCRRGTVAGGAGALGVPFTLTDENGERVTDRQVFAKPSLMYLGYTFCPDVCPLDSARNAAAVDLLEERGIEATPVFISVDPRRDTPEQLRSFTDALHPRMIGLTGSEDEIAAVAKGWRHYFKLNDQEDKENYLVDHMTNTFLVLPGHGTVDFFGRDVSPGEMADRVACFVGAA
ncbi:MAG TPA: SCO family protein [Paracoccus sp. (in: a-proteobacteria)]|nr:SCO family protein [Paracoccus sp. (in: a-proteobacteria)]